MKCSTSSCDGGCISGSFHWSSSKNSRKSRISRIPRKSSNCVLSFECSDGSVASMRYWPYFRIQQNPCQSGVMPTQSLAFWPKFRFLEFCVVGQLLSMDVFWTCSLELCDPNLWQIPCAFWNLAEDHVSLETPQVRSTTSVRSLIKGCLTET